MPSRSFADIVDTATSLIFKTLAAALGAGNLVDTLKGKGIFNCLCASFR
jgi:uncharacterized surface protein with fasciclin (FAS1) repeats